MLPWSLGIRASLCATRTHITINPCVSYNVNDQILSESYDSNGNTTATAGKTFAYDSENRLISMNGGAVSLVYDGDGNRVAKIANGVTTRYLIDDLNPTGYTQVVEETTNGAANREYTYGLQRIDEDQIVNNAWTPSFYGYDGFGTVRQLTSLTGAVTDTYQYDAFGNQITHAGTTPNNYLYRGEQYDPDLGLYYLRARYYNPLTGRFMSRDPEDGDIVNPKTLHKYLYAQGDPVNGWDPTGRADAIEVGQIDLRVVVRDAAAVYTLGVAVACELNTVTSALGLAFDPTVDKRTITPNLFSCSATASPKKDDCDKEWENARKYCAYVGSIPRNSPEWRKFKNIWGGSFDRCVRGQVSQRCGGNRVD